jgi:hypothetical protein
MRNSTITKNLAISQEDMTAQKYWAYTLAPDLSQLIFKYWTIPQAVPRKLKTYFYQYNSSTQKVGSVGTFSPLIGPYKSTFKLR